MPRDEFSQATKDTLAKRVNYCCSQCGQQTAGPQTDPQRSLSIGVAAHITAAAKGGPRYDSKLTAEQRKSTSNGIWMCQNHGTLVDADESRYTVEELLTMKAEAEASALRALERRVHEMPADVQAALKKVESLMPELLQEMRNDLAEQPLARKLVALKKGWSYWNDGSTLQYYYETHVDLDQKIGVLENLGLVSDITTKNVKQYRMSEELADYLQATEGAPRPSVVSRPDDEFIETIGVWREPSSGLHLCPRCRAEEKRTPLKKEDHGYRCTACSSYFDDPSRPRPPHHFGGTVGPDRWMS